MQSVEVINRQELPGSIILNSINARFIKQEDGLNSQEVVQL